MFRFVINIHGRPSCVMLTTGAAGILGKPFEESLELSCKKAFTYSDVGCALVFESHQKKQVPKAHEFIVLDCDVG